MSLIVRLPWPDARLMPNRAKGRAWTALATLRTTQKAAAIASTRAALRLAKPGSVEPPVRPETPVSPENPIHPGKSVGPEPVEGPERQPPSLPAVRPEPVEGFDTNIPLSLVYFAPDRRQRDLDNLLAASKPLIDGLAHALGVNDARFKPIMIDTIYCGGDACLMAAVGFELVSGWPVANA